MATVWFSHLGETPIKRDKKDVIEGIDLGEVIANVEKKYPGFKEVIFKDKSETAFDISTRVVLQPMVGRDAIDAEVLFFDADTLTVESSDDTTHP